MATISEDVFEIIKANDDGNASIAVVVGKAFGAVADTIDESLDDSYLDTRRALRHVAEEMRIVSATYN